MEQGIDTLLRLDPITRQRLALIDARVIRVVVSSPPLEVTAVVTEGRVSVATEHDDEVDLTVTGSLAALRSLAGSQDALHTGDVTITGDLRVASHLREILSGIDPDWQELVSPVIGDTATHKLERAARDALQWVSRTRDSFAEDTHDYLVDEVSRLGLLRHVFVLSPTRWVSDETRALPRGKRIRLALEELGPVFVKLGQMLSTRRDLLPDDIGDELALLQDQVAPFSSAEARAAIEQALGEPAERVFDSFDDTPIASASVAQVHGVVLKTGESAVAKILRPGIADIIDRDVALMYTLAGIAERRSHYSR